MASFTYLVLKEFLRFILIFEIFDCFLITIKDYIFLFFIVHRPKTVSQIRNLFVMNFFLDS